MVDSVPLGIVTQPGYEEVLPDNIVELRVCVVVAAEDGGQLAADPLRYANIKEKRGYVWIEFINDVVGKKFANGVVPARDLADRRILTRAQSECCELNGGRPSLSRIS